MGFRTIVVFNNDRIHEMENDPNVGKKILRDMNLPMTSKKLRSNTELGGLGSVQRCEHADSTYLAVIEDFEVTPVYAMGDKEKAVRMLKEAAMALGYNVVKRRTR